MKLTRSEFERRYAENSLRIALVGMSNIGKSYTGMRLAYFGFFGRRRQT